MNPVDVDIGNVLQDVACVLEERETGRSQSYRSEMREIEDVIYLLPGAWQNISNSLVSLDQSLAPLDNVFPDEKAGIRGGVSSSAKGFVKRIIQKSVYWYVNPVVAQLHSMHAATTRAMREVADQLKSINDRLEVLEKENLEGRVKSLEGERFDERIRRLERAWRESADEHSSNVEARLHDDADEGEPIARAVGRDRVPAGGYSHALHFDYYWFESIHRGDRALIKRRQQPYLEYFVGADNVLDIGCGRGEFLELMNEKGIGGYGIDLEADAVQYCMDIGLAAREAEALEYLATLEDDTLGGVFISQVVEHMTPAELVELVGLVARKMRQGAYVVIETPNPQCLLIFASFFYADISHVQPIHPETTRFLLLSAGFRDVEIKLTNPVPRNQRLSRVASDSADEEVWMREMNSNIDKLNSVLFSYMDYAAIGKK